MTLASVIEENARSGLALGERCIVGPINCSLCRPITAEIQMLVECEGENCSYLPNKESRSKFTLKINTSLILFVCVLPQSIPIPTPLSLLNKCRCVL